MVEIDRLSGGQALISSDVGQHQMWAAQFIAFNEPRLWLNSGGLGSMGFGLPAAIGAQFARPDKLVFAICGAIFVIVRSGRASAIIARLCVSVVSAPRSG